jgi:hypothetical protein
VKISKIRFLIMAIVCLLAVPVVWTLVEITGYGMAFNRTEFNGLKVGMSRAQAVAELKKSGVVELVALPDKELNAREDTSTDGGNWIRLGEKDYDSKIYKHDTWSYGAPNSYSTVDIKFSGNDLISIKYRWRPFEG